MLFFVYNLLSFLAARVFGFNSSLKTENLQHLNILHYQAPCQGEGVQFCYLIRTEDGETEFFYDSIEGFNYEWGHNYEIEVEKLKIENPMADASSFSYRLKKLIKKEKVPASLRFELPLKVNGYNMVDSDGKKCTYLGEIVINTGVFSCDSIAYGQAGIFQHTKDGINLIEIIKNIPDKKE